MALDLTADQLSFLFELSPDLTAVIGEEGRFMKLNPAWEKALGFSATELQAIPYLDLVHPEDRSKIQLKIYELLKGAKTVSFENRIQRKDQSYQWFAWNWHDLGGPGFYAAGRDATQLKEAEKGLEEVQEKFRVLAESATEGVAIHDQGVIVQANAALARLLGYGSPEELIGKKALEFAAPEYRELVLNYIRTGYEKPYEAMGIRKDGVRIHCRIHGGPIFYQGRTQRVTTFQDITEAKRREQELFESQELFRKLSEASQDGIAVSEKGKILMANPALARMFGREVSEMIGRNALEFTAPEFREILLQKVLDEVETKYEVMGLRRDGSRFPVEITPRMTTTQGRRVRVAFFRDITLRKKIEEEVQRQKEFNQNLINSSIDGLMAFDRECRYTLWNPAMERLTGHSREEVLGQCAFDVFPFLKQIDQDKYFYQALEGKTVATKDRPYRTPAGKQGFFESVYSPLKNTKGEIIGGLGVIHEITERKRAEEALHQTQINLRAIFQNTFQSIVLMDREGRIQTYNDNAADVFWAPDGHGLMEGRPLPDYLPPGLAEDFPLHFQKALRGEAVQFERPIPLEEGEEQWLEVGYNPVFGDEGEIEGVCLTTLNIDERKGVQRALQKSEADLRSVFNSVQQSLILVGVDGVIHDYNPRAEKSIREIRGQELRQGRDLADYVEPEHLKAFQERFKRVLKGEVVHFERTVRRLDGKDQWFAFTYNPAFDGGGKVASVCVVIASIQESKIAEEALRRSEAELKAVFNSSTHVVVLINREGRIQGFNRMAETMAPRVLGRALTPGMPFVETLPEGASREAYAKSFQGALAGKGSHAERSIRSADGEPKWVEVDYQPVLNAEGGVQGVCFSLAFIDDRKKAEEALRESEEKFRRIFDDAVIGMTLVGPDWKFIHVNQAFCDMIGYTEEEVKKLTFKDITHPDDLAENIALVEGLKSGRDFRMTKRYLHKNGGVVWVNLTVTPFLNSEGRVLYSLGTVENITEQKHAEEALRKSEADLRAVFNSGAQMIVLIETDGRIGAFNQKAYRYMKSMTGATLEIGKPFLNYVLPDIRVVFQERFLRVLKGESISVERTIQGPDGIPHWFEFTYTPVQDSQRAIIGVCMTSTDIHERKQTQESLRENQERFERLAQVTQEGVLIHENPKVVDANLALASMMGYSREEMIGKSGFDFLASESHETALKHMRQGSSKPYEALALRKDGSTFPVELQGRNFNYKGKELRVLSVHDLTWRKQAERILTESEERYRRLVELSPEAVVVHAGGKVLYVNPAGIEMFGATGQKVEGRSILDFLHPETRDAAMERVRQIMETGKATDWTEQKLLRLDSGEFVAETKGTPFLYQGIPGVLTIVRDITERKKTHQTLLRYERLAAVGKVIAAIAHEIRNPLAVVAGMSQALKMKFQNRPEFAEEVETILLQAERLRLFMTDILDYSRELLIKKTQVDLKETMEKSLKLVQSQADPLKASIAVQWDWDKDLPLLLADGERLEQILVNLILNAYQSMGRKGKLILSGRQEKGWIVLGVQDDGPGVSEADLPRLFEPFFTTKKHGSGLGLPISQKIVEAHGGKIEVERMKPHGTLFTIRFPVQKT